MQRLSLVLAALALTAVTACGTNVGDGSGSGGALAQLGPSDPRCESLCKSSDTSCATKVAECKPLCQVRVAGVSSLCATCLLEKSDGGTCGSGGPCCPNPDFPRKVVDCASSCKGSDGVNPSGNHPLCTDLCSSSDSACSAEAAQCLKECQARIQGVSGLCALCLLDGADGGTCGSGGPCCPNPSFPATVASCASFCQ